MATKRYCLNCGKELPDGVLGVCNGKCSAELHVLDVANNPPLEVSKPVSYCCICGGSGSHWCLGPNGSKCWGCQ